MEINCCQKTWSLATPNQSLWRIAYSRRPSTRIEMFESQLRNLSTGTILKIFLSLMKTIWKSHRLTSTNFRMLLWSKWDSVRSTLGTRSLGRYSSHHPWRASSFGRRSTSTRCSKAKWKSRREQASNTMRIGYSHSNTLQRINSNQPKNHSKSLSPGAHKNKPPALEIGWPTISKQPSVRSSHRSLCWQIWVAKAESVLISAFYSSKVLSAQNKVWLESVRYHLRILNLIKFSHHTASIREHLTSLCLCQLLLQAQSLHLKLTQDKILQDSSILKQLMRKKSLPSRLSFIWVKKAASLKGQILLLLTAKNAKIGSKILILSWRSQMSSPIRSSK